MAPLHRPITMLLPDPTMLYPRELSTMSIQSILSFPIPHLKTLLHNQPHPSPPLPISPKSPLLPQIHQLPPQLDLLILLWLLLKPYLLE